MILFDALLETAKQLEEVQSGKATGGTAATLIDAWLTSPANWWKGGTLWVHSGAMAGRTLVILGYDAITQTVSFAEQPGVAIAAGDLYTLARAHYSRAALVQAINTALTEMGNISQSDQTLTVVQDQEEYALPAGVGNLMQVETTTQTAAPFTWSPSYFWREVGRNLIFDQQMAPTAVGAPIRLYYNLPHTEVEADGDLISFLVHPARLAWAAAYYAAVQRSRIVTNDERMKEFLQTALGMKGVMETKFPLRNMTRAVHMARW